MRFQNGDGSRFAFRALQDTVVREPARGIRKRQVAVLSVHHEGGDEHRRHER